MRQVGGLILSFAATLSALIAPALCACPAMAAAGRHASPAAPPAPMSCCQSAPAQDPAPAPCHRPAAPGPADNCPHCQMSSTPGCTAPQPTQVAVATPVEVILPALDVSPLMLPLVTLEVHAADLSPPVPPASGSLLSRNCLHLI